MSGKAVLGGQACAVLLAVLMSMPGFAQERALTAQGQQFLMGGPEQSQVRATSREDPYNHTANLNDVTSGSNGRCSPSYLCTAGVGYDGPTGLGTPNGVIAFGQ
jgi:hypothetical protein